MKLAEGKSIPASSLNTEMAQQMQQDRILIVVPHGSYQSLRATDVNTVRHYLASQYDIRDLEAQLSLMENEQIDRASQVRVSGNSKMIRHRTFQGFLVNSFQPIPAILNDVPITVSPPRPTQGPNQLAQVYSQSLRSFRRPRPSWYCHIPE